MIYIINSSLHIYLQTSNCVYILQKKSKNGVVIFPYIVSVMVPLLGMKDGGGGGGGGWRGGGGVERGGGGGGGGWEGGVGGGDLSEPSRPIMILIPRFLPQDFGFKNGLGNLPCRIDRSWGAGSGLLRFKGTGSRDRIQIF